MKQQEFLYLLKFKSLLATEPLENIEKICPDRQTYWTFLLLLQDHINRGELVWQFNDEIVAKEQALINHRRFEYPDRDLIEFSNELIRQLNQREPVDEVLYQAEQRRQLIGCWPPQDLLELEIRDYKYFELLCQNHTEELKNDLGFLYMINYINTIYPDFFTLNPSLLDSSMEIGEATIRGLEKNRSVEAKIYQKKFEYFKTHQQVQKS